VEGNNGSVTLIGLVSHKASGDSCDVSDVTNLTVSVYGDFLSPSVSSVVSELLSGPIGVVSTKLSSTTRNLVTHIIKQCHTHGVIQCHSHTGHTHTMSQIQYHITHTVSHNVTHRGAQIHNVKHTRTHT